MIFQELCSQTKKKCSCFANVVFVRPKWETVPPNSVGSNAFLFSICTLIFRCRLVQNTTSNSRTNSERDLFPKTSFHCHKKSVSQSETKSFGSFEEKYKTMMPNVKIVVKALSYALSSVHLTCEVCSSPEHEMCQRHTKQTSEPPVELHVAATYT